MLVKPEKRKKLALRKTRHALARYAWRREVRRDQWPGENIGGEEEEEERKMKNKRRGEGIDTRDKTGEMGNENRGEVTK